MLKQFIKTELDKLFKTDYYGTEEQIENEQQILNASALPMTDEETIEEYYMKIYDSLTD
jgi:hypothetical protein